MDPSGDLESESDDGSVDEELTLVSTRPARKSAELDDRGSSASPFISRTNCKKTRNHKSIVDDGNTNVPQMNCGLSEIGRSSDSNTDSTGTMLVGATSSTYTSNESGGGNSVMRRHQKDHGNRGKNNKKHHKSRHSQRDVKQIFEADTGYTFQESASSNISIINSRVDTAMSSVSPAITSKSHDPRPALVNFRGDSSNRIKLALSRNKLEESTGVPTEREAFYSLFTNLMNMSMPSKRDVREKECNNNVTPALKSPQATSGQMLCRLRSQTGITLSPVGLWHEINSYLINKSSDELLIQLKDLRSQQMTKVCDTLCKFCISGEEHSHLAYFDDLSYYKDEQGCAELIRALTCDNSGDLGTPKGTPSIDSPMIANDYIMSVNYLRLLDVAFGEVKVVLDEVDELHQLWPTYKALSKDCPLLCETTMGQKVILLNLWSNIVKELYAKVDLLIKVLGLNCVAEDVCNVNACDFMSSPLFKLIRLTNCDANVTGDDNSLFSSDPKRLLLKMSDVTKYRDFADHCLKFTGVSKMLRRMQSILCGIISKMRCVLLLIGNYHHHPHTASSSQPAKMIECYKALYYPDLLKINLMSDNLVTDAGLTDRFMDNITLSNVKGIFTQSVGSVESTTRSFSSVLSDKSASWEDASIASDVEKVLLEGTPFCNVVSEMYRSMSLPSFMPVFLFLCRIPVDVMHACLQQRLGQPKCDKPSFASLGELISECKEVLEGCVRVRRYYIRMVTEPISKADAQEHFICDDFDEFFKDFNEMFNVYYGYVTRRMKGVQKFNGPLLQANMLDDEWCFMKKVSTFIDGGESEAARKFCLLVSRIFMLISNYLEKTFRLFMDGFMTNDELSYLSNQTSLQSSGAGAAGGTLSFIENVLLEEEERSSSMLDSGEGSEYEEVEESLEDEESCNLPVVIANPLTLQDESVIRTIKNNQRQAVSTVCKDIKALLNDIRARFAKAMGCAKMLRKDLEFAAEFSIRETCLQADLLRALRDSGHSRLLASVGVFAGGHGVFASRNAASSETVLQSLLLTSSYTKREASNVVEPGSTKDHGYVLFVEGLGRIDEREWGGNELRLEATAEKALLTSHSGQVHGVLLIACHNDDLECQIKGLMDSSLGEYLEPVNQSVAVNASVASAWKDLKKAVMELRKQIDNTISEIEEELQRCCGANLNSSGNSPNHNSHNSVHAKTCWRETLLSAFTLGFDYDQELVRLHSDQKDIRNRLLPDILSFAFKWMDFVRKHCEPGRGKIPRWSGPGCEHLMWLCNPKLSSLYTDSQFKDLKHGINFCIVFILGTTPPRHSLSTIAPLLGAKGGTLNPTQSNPGLHDDGSSNVSSEGLSAQVSSIASQTSLGSDTMSSAQSTRQKRVMDRLSSLEENRVQKIKDTIKLGKVVANRSRRNDQNDETLKRMQKLFNLEYVLSHRKIGEGRFGIVQTARNLTNNAVMAVKKIVLKPDTLDNLVTEIDRFTKYSCPYLVHYYGIDLDDVGNVLIFMEYCAGGNLAVAAQEGLPETFSRRYTFEILKGVKFLHDNGIVHRDLKPPNVFLCENGSIKLGDFGSCIMLMSTTCTQTNELMSQQGLTYAYIAPEVARAGSDLQPKGYGRASDIWSVGCIVLEMLTGKPPWHNLIENPMICFQLFYQNAPPFDSINPNSEGFSFLTQCFIMEPSARPTAFNLLTHPFVKCHEMD